MPRAIRAAAFRDVDEQDRYGLRERAKIGRVAEVATRVLRQAAEEAGASWTGFHTFRHSCASMLFEGGKNAKQVQTWLGHHSPSFTVDTYVHLLRDGPGEPLDLASELSEASGDQWQIAQVHGS